MQRATVIVTQNLRDFPAEALPGGIVAMDADAFLLDLLETDATEVYACIRAQARDTGKHGKPAIDLATTLARLEPETPRFVSRLRDDLAVR